MTPVWQRPSWWIGVVFAGIGVAVIATSFELSLRGKLFPLAIGVPVILLALTHTIVSLWRGRLPGEDAAESDQPADRLDLSATLRALGWIVGLIATVLLIGQRIAIPLFVFAYMFAHGERPWKGLLAAAISAIFIYVVLERTIGIRFPLPYLAYWLR